jgi:hypothetical protein
MSISKIIIGFLIGGFVIAGIVLLVLYIATINRNTVLTLDTNTGTTTSFVNGKPTSNTSNIINTCTVEGFDYTNKNDTLIAWGTSVQDPFTVEIYKSTDKGKSFTPIINKIYTSAITFIGGAVNKKDGQYMLVAYYTIVNEHQLLYFLTSKNGGKDWDIRGVKSDINTSYNFNKCSLSHTGEYMYISLNDGIYISTNYGDDFNNYIPNINISSLCTSYEGEYIFASDIKGNHIYRSENMGKDWKILYHKVRKFVQACSFDGKVLYALTIHNEVVISRDYGETFIYPSSEMSFEIDIRTTNLQCSPKGDQIIVNDSSKPNSYFSKNFAEIWTMIE